MRDYKVLDDGDEVQVQLMMDGRQLGCVLFPEDDEYDEFVLALELGEAWKALP